MKQLNDKLRVGIIQTNIDIDTAWRQDGELIQCMNPEAQNIAVDEIRRGFKEFSSRGKSAPRIVLVPEYSIPHFAIHHVERMAREIDAVLIGGCDLFVENGNASNRGIIVVPNKWPALEPAFRSTSKYMGKKYFSKPEFDWFDSIHVSPISDETHYIIDAGPYGKIGVAICADFYDIERFVIYKGRIHHLIIIAYNKDTRSFSFLTEAIARLLMCNVIICNTGHYGDSLCFSPYDKEYKRIIYRNSGANLFSAQVIDLPVDMLDKEQNLASQIGEKTTGKMVFKNTPGFKKF